MKNNPPPIMLSSGYARMLASNQVAFLTEQKAKAPVNFKLSSLVKNGKKARKARREMYQDYYKSQYE